MASEDQERFTEAPAQDEDVVKAKSIQVNNVIGNQPLRETAVYEDRTGRKRPSYRISHSINSNGDDCEHRPQPCATDDTAINLESTGPTDCEDLSHYDFNPKVGSFSQSGGASPNPKYSAKLAQVFREEQIMDNHNSYHEDITAAEAQERLKMCGSHCYLTRYSRSNQCYVLTVYKEEPKNQTIHFPISFFDRDGGKVYKIRGMDREFRNLEEMLQHYQQNRIDPGLRNIGRCVTEDEYKAKTEDKNRATTRHRCTLL